MKRDDCPICGKAPDPAFKPFCGRGCKDRDLLQWLGEGYRLPGAAIDPDDVEGAQSGLDRGERPD
ncbi:DNA gyrase inhibitor YacG [Sphingomonas koreensis]